MTSYDGIEASFAKVAADVRSLLESPGAVSGWVGPETAGPPPHTRAAARSAASPQYPSIHALRRPSSDQSTGK
jgi:hypothetical protein